MAGGITDGEKDGLVILPGLTKGFFAPGIPVDGIFGMLKEIRAFFPDQMIIRMGGLLSRLNHARLL
jgi:hypothetical protein